MRIIVVLALAASLSGCLADKGTSYVQARMEPVQEETLKEEPQKTPRSRVLVDAPNLEEKQKSPMSMNQPQQTPFPAPHPDRAPLAKPSVMNKRALREPTTKDYINAATQYDFVPFKVYKIFCSPMRVTNLIFEKTELVSAVNTGDDVRWLIELVNGHSGDNIFIKPVEGPISTNVVVTTNKRTYYLELVSNEGEYQMAVSWKYADMTQIIKRDVTEIEEKQKERIEEESRPRYYSYESKGDQAIQPMLVYDDGRKTFIQFRPDIQELPALYVYADGVNNQVNYRVKGGNTYEVDRLFTEARLILGSKTVKILKR